ncbi:hypothetical protein [Roseivivax isoporae]|uniref:Uncharacterized protein n=1 Tax=Roseivivax isoporae LMG 25204 TaxID=1449351 RepID=X7F483_9RHOB|nr:hypothetical protein [Roseivivax isoporae]ETX27513.1 hypothetical protein RISW2_13355 [Roseivivax isoporae LMG 25204]
MVFELMAVIVAGFAGAGAMLVVTQLLRGLPRWLVPLTAGVAMLGTSIALEYGWYARTAAGLPAGVVVAEAASATSWWRPWTYAVPMVERFIALDTGNLHPNAETEGLYMADLYFYGRWRPVQSVQVMVDCPGGRRADPAGGDGGAPVWRDVGAGDPIVSAVCGAV